MAAADDSAALGADEPGGGAPDAGLLRFDARARHRLLLHSVVRILAVTTLFLVVYFWWPVGRDTNVTGLFVLAAGLVGFFAAVAYHVRRIVDSPVPQLRAAEALGTAIPLFIVIFALVYVLMSTSDPGHFTQPITKITGLYFTVTVLSTVGFGDITAVTDTARLIVTLQMIVDLVLIGLVVRVIMGASRIGLERRRSEAEAAGRDAGRDGTGPDGRT